MNESFTEATKNNPTAKFQVRDQSKAKQVTGRESEHLHATLLQLIRNLFTLLLNMFTGRKIGKTGSKLLRACSVLALLFLYILGSVELESLHNFSHEEEFSQLHSAENEADPCHLTIFHDQPSAGCEHPTHVTKEDTCSLCDSQLHNVHILLSFHIDIDSFSITDPSIQEDPRSVEGFFSYLPGRAPPVL